MVKLPVRRKARIDKLKTYIKNHRGVAGAQLIVMTVYGQSISYCIPAIAAVENWYKDDRNLRSNSRQFLVVLSGPLLAVTSLQKKFHKVFVTL